MLKVCNRSDEAYCSWHIRGPTGLCDHMLVFRRKISRSASGHEAWLLATLTITED